MTFVFNRRRAVFALIGLFLFLLITTGVAHGLHKDDIGLPLVFGVLFNFFFFVILGFFIYQQGKKDESRYGEYERMASGLIHSLPGMIYKVLMSKEGVMSCQFVNDEAFHIYELTRADYEKDDGVFNKMIHPEDATSAGEAITKSAQTLKRFEWRGRIITRSGQVKWIFAQSIPHRQKDGSTAWYGIIMDITRELQVADELAFERVKASHAAKLASLGEMASGVVHEINNPLTVISATVSRMDSLLNDPEEFQKRVDIVNRNVLKINRIVESLKKYSRPSSQISLVATPLKKVIEEALFLTELKANSHSVILKLDIQSEGVTLCDEMQIEQVMVNLVNNSIDAIKALPERWVKITLTEDDQHLILQVRDSGAGIPQELRAKVFEPFFTTKPIGQGTGLGLAIVKQLLKEHEAEISIKDEPNTCFELRFRRIANCPL